MKKLIIATVVVAAIISTSSCSNKVRCYECDMQKNGNWQDAGCYTKDEWKSIQFTDITGNGNLDKSEYCRVRK